MGINSLNNTAQEIITGVSGGVTSGDLVSNSETGYITTASAVLGVGVESNATAGPAAVKAIATVENNSNYDGSGPALRRMCELGNGNVAFIYSGDGTTANTGVKLRIRNVLGADVVPAVTLTADITVNSYRCAKLNSTQFVVAWASSSILKFMVLNNDGTTAVAATTVATMTSSTTAEWNMGVTAAGEVVFAYRKSTADCAFKRYSAAGVLQGAETTIEAAASPQYLAVLGCANGDFVVSYYRAATTAAYKFARYTSAGVIIGSLVTVITTASYIGYGDFSNGLIELIGSNIVLATASSTSTYPSLYVYDASNTLVNFINLGTATLPLGEVPQLIPLSAGGFAVIGRSQTSSTRIATYNASGSGIMPWTTFGAGAGGNTAGNGSGITAFSLGAAGFAFLRIGSDGTNMDARLSAINNQGVLVGSEIVLKTADTNLLYNPSAILTSGGILCFAYKSAAIPYLADGYYNVFRRSILGVAAETKAKDQQVRVLTNGTYPINQAMSAGGSFDNTAASVPGAKGAVVGSTAILRGTK